MYVQTRNSAKCFWNKKSFARLPIINTDCLHNITLLNLMHRVYLFVAIYFYPSYCFIWFLQCKSEVVNFPKGYFFNQLYIKMLREKQIIKGHLSWYNISFFTLIIRFILQMHGLTYIMENVIASVIIFFKKIKILTATNSLDLSKVSFSLQLLKYFQFDSNSGRLLTISLF